MTPTQVLDLKGKKVGEIELEESVFATELKVGPMHQAVIRQLANARSGSANTKTRAEVRGGGRKPWRQKGTGRARAGSIRSPLWHGGGVVFGPKPRSYVQSMPQKMRQVAVRSALSVAKDKLVVVKSFDGFGEPKTKAFAQLLKDLNVEQGKKILLVLTSHKQELDAKIQRAARNIDKLKVIWVNQVNVKDLLHHDVVVISQEAVEILNKNLKTKRSENAKPKKEKAQKKAKKEVKKPVKKEAKPKEKKAAKPKEIKPPKPVKEEKQKAKAEKAPAKKSEGDKETKKSTAKSDKPKSDKPKKKD